MDNGCCGEYQLEQDNDNLRTTDRGQSQKTSAYVLLRLEQGSVKRVRIAMAGCRLNAGGVPFVWLTDVNPDESVALIAKLISQDAPTNNKRLSDPAFAVLSVHSTPKATDVLVGFTAAGNASSVREKAAFWLGAQRGHEGFVALQRLLRNERDNKFREKLVFDIFVNPDAAVTDELIQLAKSDSDTGVRGQALFWLAQKAGKKATATLSDAIANDPEITIKKKAVFGLSQLPKDESIPQLIHVAETNPSPAIRKEAIFWLGQTNDSRAVQYLEEVLKR
jgi:HEAT repeat protein